MIWSEKSEVRQVRSNARRWSLGKFIFSFQYVVDVNQLYHLNKHLWIMLLTTLTMNRIRVNRKLKEKWIESFNLLIPAQTVYSDDGKKSFFSGDKNGLSAILR